jgi:hypothetical protein
MSLLFASMEPKAQLRSFPGSWQTNTVQRKCACGGSGNGRCHCDKPHSSSEAISAMHDFSRMRVHAGSHEPNLLPELSCFGRVREDAGDTGCDVEKGVPDVAIHAPSLCYRQCTERHEEVHRKDLSPCCKKAHSAWESAKSDDKKKAVQDKMNNWVESNADWLQCRAYAESVRCADEFLAAHCGAKKAGADSGAPGKDSPVSAPGEPSKMTGGPDEVPGVQSASRVADEATKDAPPFNPEICCSTVKEYRRVSNLRRDAFCKEGKKGPKPCPF